MLELLITIPQSESALRRVSYNSPPSVVGFICIRNVTSGFIAMRGCICACPELDEEPDFHVERLADLPTQARGRQPYRSWWAAICENCAFCVSVTPGDTRAIVSKHRTSATSGPCLRHAYHQHKPAGDNCAVVDEWRYARTAFPMRAWPASDNRVEGSNRRTRAASGPRDKY